MRVLSCVTSKVCGVIFILVKSTEANAESSFPPNAAVMVPSFQHKEPLKQRVRNYGLDRSLHLCKITTWDISVYKLIIKELYVTDDIYLIICTCNFLQKSLIFKWLKILNKLCTISVVILQVTEPNIFTVLRNNRKDKKGKQTNLVTECKYLWLIMDHQLST